MPLISGPMTPDEVMRMRSRAQAARSAITDPNMPTDLQSGMTRLGQGIAFALMQSRLANQPGGAIQPPTSPIQRMAESISGNTMPWQFPAAPSMPAQASNMASQPSVGSPVTPTTAPPPSQAPSTARHSTMAMGGQQSAPAFHAGTSIPVSSTPPSSGPGFGSGFFDFLKPKIGGLW